MGNTQNKEELTENIKVDRPIKCKNDDLFDRQHIANTLTKTIKNYKESDSISIGIIGDWGSGKTSFINMVLEDFNDDKKFIIINFNPWNISTRKQLISDFFTKLSIEIGRKNTSKRYKKLSNGLKVLSYTFKPFKFIPGLDIASEISDNISNALQEIAEMTEKNLDTAKEEINNVIKKIDKKIIIVIDDLDRLADTDIQEIFQLVRSIADFKNTMYILAYDNEIVTKALDKIQKDKGERYIEKIVQVPIVLPKLNEVTLKKIFLEKINNIKLKYPKLDDGRLAMYAKNLVKCFHSLRDVNRYINILSFEINAIEEDLFLYDFAVITLIKIFEPTIYDYIYQQKTIAIYNHKEIPTNKIKFNIICELLKSCEQINVKTKRITSSIFFDNYFALSFPKNGFSQKTLNLIINATTYDEFKNIFKTNNISTLEKLNDLYTHLKDNHGFTYLKNNQNFLLYLFDFFNELMEEFHSNQPNNPHWDLYFVFYKFFSDIDLNEKISSVLNKDLKSTNVEIFYMLCLDSHKPQALCDKNTIDNLMDKYKKNNKNYIKNLHEFFYTIYNENHWVNDYNIFAYTAIEDIIKKYQVSPTFLNIILELFIQNEAYKQEFLIKAIEKKIIDTEYLIKIINNCENSEDYKDLIAMISKNNQP
ncbi:hypothetical protein FVD15_03325 [Campylobacter volucris]|uniref:KAP NTPase domain-containing protein n=1 Tax=Campylobacter volucris TaxID=1031542 RepID=A0AAE5YHI2_9BACT|nr:P-loop NTPase fold protein [Campylobacter volucris]AJC94161.1 KAP family P-loop domain protein [Campylobacter volucris LMG 24379]KAB0580319.1 hypothetical protein F7P61_01550 [Campylobacter volucris]QBL13467.1 hypothetical protein A9460_03635 [Campylobacter volucris]QEL08377.1 KAP family NTPase [Campylobacter volucris]TXK70504.1 hypothetical protein FVD15_03325 [Campylobacter volucris]